LHGPKLKGGLIIDDDYDSEYRYAARPHPAWSWPVLDGAILGRAGSANSCSDLPRWASAQIREGIRRIAKAISA
jgi:DNA-binding transcriptional MocR family regulator